MKVRVIASRPDTSAQPDNSCSAAVRASARRARALALWLDRDSTLVHGTPCEAGAGEQCIEDLADGALARKAGGLEVLGNARLIDDLHVGLRGELLPVRVGRGRVRQRDPGA